MKRTVYLNLFFVILLVLSTSAYSQSYTWELANGPFQGPLLENDRFNPPSGDVIAFAGNSVGDLFAAMMFGAGIFRSTDAGKTWVQINSGLPLTDTNIFALIINSDDELFAATEDNGIYKSVDNGNTWIPKYPNAHIEAFAINSSGHIFASLGTSGILRSTDNGDNWALLNEGLPAATEIKVLVANSNGYLFAGAYDEGIFRSEDNGDSWQKLNNSLSNVTVTAFAANDSGHVFAGIEDGGLYRSRDNGATWIQLDNRFLNNSTVDAVTIDASGDIFALAGIILRSKDSGESWTQLANILQVRRRNTLSTNANGELFAGTSHGGVFRYDDAIDAWHQISHDLTFPRLTVTSIIPGGDLLVGTQGSGLFRSSNHGKTWMKVNRGLNTLGALAPSAIAFNASGTLFVATRDGVFRSGDSGDTWFPASNGITSTNIATVVINNEGDLFAGANGVFRSQDNGESWTPVNSGLIIIHDTVVGALVAKAAGDMFAGTNRGDVFRSTDNGDSWRKMSTNLPAKSDREIIAIKLNSKEEIIVVAADGIFHSTDIGVSWTQIDGGVTTSEISTITINSMDHIFMGTRGDGVFLSKDNGGTWTPINEGFPIFRGFISDIKAVAIDSSGNLFVGTSGDGVFRSLQPSISVSSLNVDFGSVRADTLRDSTIRLHNHGAVNLRIISMSLTSGSNDFSLVAPTRFPLLVAPGDSLPVILQFSPATTGQKRDTLVVSSNDPLRPDFSIALTGVGDSPTSVFSSDSRSVPDNFELEQNFPNPFNPETTIRFVLPIASNVVLSIYDLTGKKVNTLVDHEKPAGIYSVKWNGRDGSGSEVASGVYFYRLKTGEFVQVKKLTLLR